MARNTQVAADHHAPPVTRILAEYVAQHPSRGWSDAVDQEAHRTFLNWLGCAVGASHHESVGAALAAVQMLQPAPQATVLGRAERVDMASAALVNGISSHTFDFDDTHLKTIIHPAGPVASALLAVELLVDKVPGVDSVNDVVQTVVRPLAGAVETASANEPLPDALRFVTMYTSPPRPPVAWDPYPSAPGNAGSCACASCKTITRIASIERMTGIVPERGIMASSGE